MGENAGNLVVGDPRTDDDALDRLLAELAVPDDDEITSEDSAGSYGLLHPRKPPIAALRAEHPTAPSCLGDSIQLTARTRLEHPSCISCSARGACDKAAGEYLRLEARGEMRCLGHSFFYRRISSCASCSLTSACGDIVDAIKVIQASGDETTTGSEAVDNYVSRPDETLARDDRSATSGQRPGDSVPTAPQVSPRTESALTTAPEDIDPELDRLLTELASPSVDRNNPMAPLPGERALSDLPSTKPTASEVAASASPHLSIVTATASHAPAAPAAAKSAPRPTDYSFPARVDIEAKIEHSRSQSTETLLGELKALTDFGASSADAEIYAARRFDSCAIGWALNERRKVPPALRSGFRPRQPGKSKVYSHNDRMLANDLRVLDLHWLLQTGRLRITSLIDNMGQLDLVKAAAWSSTKTDGADRAADLQISESIARELAICRPKSIADQQRRDRDALIEALPKIHSALARADNRRRDDPMTIFRVMKALLLTRDESDASAAALLPMLDGPNWDARKVRSCRDWLKKQGVLKL